MNLQKRVEELKAEQTKLQQELQSIKDREQSILRDLIGCDRAIHELEVFTKQDLGTKK